MPTQNSQLLARQLGMSILVSNHNGDEWETVLGWDGVDRWIRTQQLSKGDVFIGWWRFAVQASCEAKGSTQRGEAGEVDWCSSWGNATRQYELGEYVRFGKGTEKI